MHCGGVGWHASRRGSWPVELSFVAPLLDSGFQGDTWGVLGGHGSGWPCTRMALVLSSALSASRVQLQF